MDNTTEVVYPRPATGQSICLFNSTSNDSSYGERCVPLHPQDDFIDTAQPLEKLVRFLHMYATLVFVAVGVVLNIPCIIVFMRKRLRYFSTSHYITGFLCAEILYLLVWSEKWLNDYTQATDLYRFGGLCQLFTMLENASKFLRTCMVILWTLDRYVYNCHFEYAIKHWFKSTMAGSLCVFATVMSLVIYLNVATLFVETPFAGHSYCGCAPSYSSANKKLEISDIIFSVVITHAFVIGASAAIASSRLKAFIKERKERQNDPLDSRESTTASDSDTVLNAEYKALEQTRTHLIFIVVYIVFTVPYDIVWIIFSAHLFTGRSRSNEDILNGYLWRQAFLYLMWLRVVLNLPVFFAANYSFRKGMARLFCTCPCRRWRRTARPNRPPVKHANNKTGRPIEQIEITETAPVGLSKSNRGNSKSKPNQV